MIQAVVFDLFETLVTEATAAVQRASRLATRLGVSPEAYCFHEGVAGWDRSPLGPLFDVTVFSCAVSLAKPDPEVYLLACRELDVPPSETLYVGDGADDELVGARTAGLSAHRALWFLSRWPQFRQAPDDAGLWRITDVLDLAA